MTEEEQVAFLAQGIMCRLGCLDDEGAPYVVPVWFEYADGGFYLVPRARSAWAGHLKRDGRVSLCIDTDDGRRVLVRGTARIVEEPNVGGAWVHATVCPCRLPTLRARPRRPSSTFSDAPPNAHRRACAGRR